MDYPIASFVARLKKEGAIKSVDKADTIEGLLSTLTEQQEQIVRLRHGIGPYPTHTLAQIGDIVGLSKERVRQIENRAFRQFRWIIHHQDVDDELAFASYLKQRAAKSAAVEQQRQQAAISKIREVERKRHDKEQRAEARRTHARKAARERKLKQTESEYQGMKGQADIIQKKIAKIERRGWFARTILPHESKLAALHKKNEQLRQRIETATAILAQIVNNSPTSESEADEGALISWDAADEVNSNE
ncbi:sigma factor-like helix-turn-helix DNA-binding protein [Acidocella aminolytica]|uniref:DNA-directed RNA polymerase sigma factor n=1 Tax=Acidocella aminolytica 101 = DSM 11237 TaxID=1120923 RepID=A0A0D6PGB1_9PROT|nr:sigma factor-like helix-turn-helix DNA-binding protein [Acidocella aminolytica]GAN80416.1 DNA-directed RNA polymerase sigma factor [Acidocella aminolytica 101 = DSM 11237]GBQ36243.1 hypothetical protein AA11237_1191 [Acidocella aminolytica 101 = DSM 11237]SHF45123.1 Sigma-70, region 4 [Acidocella aminolytica 101 = DSM 11237]